MTLATIISSACIGIFTGLLTTIFIASIKICTDIIKTHTIDEDEEQENRVKQLVENADNETLLKVLPMYKRRIIISIEGLIGVGKTTFLTKLANEFKTNPILSHYKIKFIEEPVDEWISIKSDDGKDNILGVFYKDMPRWSASFQTLAFITRFKRLIKCLQEDNDIIILDRSMETDMNVFAQMLKDDKNISEMEWNMYQKWNDIHNILFPYISKKNVVYLKCSPEIAHQRIMKRGREEEKNTKLEYLINLGKYHDNWLLGGNPDYNVLTVDSNEDFEKDETIFKRIIDTFIDYLNKI